MKYGEWVVVVVVVVEPRVDPTRVQLNSVRITVQSVQRRAKRKTVKREPLAGSRPNDGAGRETNLRPHDHAPLRRWWMSVFVHGHVPTTHRATRAAFGQCAALSAGGEETGHTPCTFVLVYI